MAGLRLRLIIASCLGAVAGMLLSFFIMAMRYQAGLGLHFDYLDVWLKASGYFSTLGGYSSIYFKLMVGAVIMMVVFMLFAAFSMRKGELANLKKIYSELDLNSRYVVRQRSRETLFIGFGFMVCVILILFTFRWLHAGIQSGDYMYGGSVNPFPGVTLIVTFGLTVVCTYGATLALIAYRRYGRFTHVPIEIKNDSINYFHSFYGLPMIAIDRPVQIELDDAEIDFDSQSAKGSLYVSDYSDRVAFSPKLEFIHGSFDELADFLEKYAVEDEES